MITKENYKDAASRIGCEPAVVRAVDIVEAPRGGFDAQGRLTLLFEPHIFYKELKKQGIDPIPLAKQHPTLLSPVWNPQLYGPSSRQWGKLEQAITINKTAALKSASYGRYQILGQNFRSAGFSSPEAMVTAYKQGEVQQLNSFVQYILNNGLDDELRAKDWKSFARQYNGPLYWKNAYDTKLAKAYESARLQGY